MDGLISRKMLSVIKFIGLAFLLLNRDTIGYFIIGKPGFSDTNSYLSLILGGVITIGYIFVSFGYLKGEKYKKLFSRKKLNKGLVILSFSTVLIFKAIPLFGLVLMFGLVLRKYPTFHLPGDIVTTFLMGFEMLLVAPLVEELSFRGIVFSRLRAKLPLVWSLLVSALIFALLHSSGGLELATITIIGILLAYLYEKTKSLRYPLIIHSLLNLFTFASWFITY